MVRFVEPSAVWVALALPLGLFTAIGGVLWLVLTRDDAVRPIFRDGFGRSVIRVRRSVAAAVLVPLWVGLAAWLSSSRVRAPFHAIERLDGGSGVEWVLHRERPWRRMTGRSSRLTIPDSRVASFGIGNDFSRRLPRPCLVVVTSDGRRYRSAGVHRSVFERDRLPELEAIGIDVRR